MPSTVLFASPDTRQILGDMLRHFHLQNASAELVLWLFVGGFAGFFDILGFLVNCFADIFIPSYQGLPSGPYYCLEDIWQKEIVRAPLNQRGWVFQER